MTAVIIVTCDGHRHGQPCRGAYPTRTDQATLAFIDAADHGWRDTGRLDLCPSRGHDEERPC